jgi:hypothetical protein
MYISRAKGLMYITWKYSSFRVQLKRDGTRWRTGGEGGKWRGIWRMEWVASTLHTTSEYGVSRVTTAYAHTSAANSRLNWHPCLFKWTRPFRWKTKSGFCACAITFQTQSTPQKIHPVYFKKPICKCCVRKWSPFVVGVIHTAQKHGRDKVKISELLNLTVNR